MKRVICIYIVWTAALCMVGVPSARGDDPARRLSLGDAVRLALEQNLTIQVRRLDPQIQDLAIAQARTAWTPNVLTTITDGTNNVPSTSIFAGAQGKLTLDQFNATVGTSQLLPWGASYSLGWNNARVRSNSLFDTPNPAISSTLTGSYVQPLLRDFKIDRARQQLQVTKTNRDISDIRFKQTVLTTVRDVKIAYWELAYAISSLRIQQQSLELAQASLRNSRSRLGAGIMAPVDVAEAEAEVAQREEAVIVAEAAIGRADDRLRALIFDPAMPEFWSMNLELTDAVSVDPRPIDLDGAVRNALERRTDLLSARKSAELTDIDIQYFRNQRLPDVRATVSYALAGQGGTAWQFGQGFPPSAIGQRDSGYASALNSLFGNNYPSWALSLMVTHPVGTSAAEASLIQARLQHNQTQTQIRNLELEVATEVRDTGRQVNTNMKRIDATTAARQLAERRLDAEEKKFAAGMSTSFLVFQAQRDLAQARNAEVRAVLDYNTSLVDFETIQEAPSPRRTAGRLGGMAASTSGQ